MEEIVTVPVPFFSFQSAPIELRDEWNDAASRVISSGRFIGGQFVEAFEGQWAEYLGVDHAIGVGNGYDALFIALKVLNIGPGDLVVVPAHTFMATWLAVHAVGATPVGVDCDRSGLLDLDLLEQLPRTPRAVIPVHMHGLMVDMERLMNWAKPKGIAVIEDCAQAHGARLAGKQAGTWGDLGAFSFYPTKNLGALGDAGAIVTNDALLASAIRSFGNYGTVIGNKYAYSSFGVNSRLDPIQASYLSVNLKYLDIWNARRQEIAAAYLAAVTELGIQPLHSNSRSVWHHFAILVKDRTQAVVALQDQGIGTEIHYPTSAAEEYAKISKSPTTTFPVSELISRHILSLPISQWMDNTQVASVVQALDQESLRRSFLGEME